MEENKRARIFLIYSSERKDKENTSVPTKAFDRNWAQMELFPTAGPETLVFVRPDEEDLLDTIRTAGAKHILDLRDVPYLTLSGLDRQSFFDALRKLVVDYAGVHALVHKTGNNSVSDFLRSAIVAAHDPKDLLEDALVRKLATGPTIVMCDESPGSDSKVGVLLDYLSKKRVKHRPVLAVH